MTLTSSSRRRALAAAAAALTAPAWTGASLAQAAWPNRPLRMVIPFPAGGTADVLGRLMAERLAAAIGQPIVIDNRPGAAGNVGSEAGAKAPADGYHLMYGTIGTHGGINLALYPKLPFDPVKDFAPIALAHTLPNVLIVHPDVPVKSVSELIAWLKANPGRANFASSGNGGISHLGGELFKTMTGVSMTHVPYKGGAAALTDLIGGRVQLMFETAPNALTHVRAGKVRGLAVSSARRSGAAPDLPPIGETVPGYEVTTWTALYAPAGTPREIVQRLSAEMARLAKDRDYDARLAQIGSDAPESSPEHLAAYMQSEIAKWGKLVRDTGAKID
jgi:tripartite-type tricarboxylate transporter receptor subunit TctC